MIKMTLIYLASLLVLFQAIAQPLNDEDMTTTDLVILGNNATELDNSTDVSLTPLTGLISINETMENTTGEISNEDSTTFETTEFDGTVSSSSEPAETNPPPTKKANIENLGVMTQAGTLAIVLPVCIRLVTLWNSCL